MLLGRVAWVMIVIYHSPVTVSPQSSFHAIFFFQICLGSPSHHTTAHHTTAYHTIPFYFCGCFKSWALSKYPFIYGTPNILLCLLENIRKVIYNNRYLFNLTKVKVYYFKDAHILACQTHKICQANTSSCIISEKKISSGTWGKVRILSFLLEKILRLRPQTNLY